MKQRFLTFHPLPSAFFSQKSSSTYRSESVGSMIWKRGLSYSQVCKHISQSSCKLNTLGYRVGSRVLELTAYRAESSSKAPKREIRLLPALMAIHTQIWRAVFGRPADAIEKSVENVDECRYFSTNINLHPNSASDRYDHRQ